MSLSHALYRAEQVRELDRLAIEEFGIDGHQLMERAGAAAFKTLRRRWPAARSLVVVCGTGNNGGDGYVVARLAHRAGLAATVLQLGDGARIAGAAQRARGEWLDAGGSVQPFGTEALRQADVVVDAIFGTGLQRPVREPWFAVIEAVNAVAAPVLSLDIPSGLHPDTGAVLGVAVDADVTVSFIGLKQGQFTGSGPDLCGNVVFNDLDIPAEIYLRVPPAASRLGDELLARLLPARARTTHKGDCGHVLVIGGDQGFSGAVRLAAEAALRVGAGLVSVATRAQHTAAIVTARPELMCHGVERGQQLRPLLKRADVVAIGPGLGQSDWGRSMLSQVLDSDHALVVDADALNLLAMQNARRGNWVLTPHPGEAARLLHTTVDAVQADRFAAITALTEAFDGTCVLKGAGTLVKARAAAVYVCNAGNPGMASGGMGDVLTGIIAGLRAQGLDGEDAARAGVCMHALAADAAAVGGERGLLATDLLAALRRVANPNPPRPGLD